MVFHDTIKLEFSDASQAADEIPPLSHDEALRMAAEELRRFLSMVETLNGDDWTRPTACTLWSVRDLVAHQAAHVRSFLNLGEFMSQSRPALLRSYRQQGMNILDAMNQAQVDLRRNVDTRDLIAEIRDLADFSLRSRARLPGWIRTLKPPLPGLEKGRSLGYLFDLIYTRDMWMHRIDICRAVGRAMPLDAAHDGRSVALIVRDFAENVTPLLNGRSAILRLTGEAGGSYRVGSGAATVALEVDALEFCILTSGRSTPQDLVPDAAISGDVRLGSEVLKLSYNRVMY